VIDRDQKCENAANSATVPHAVVPRVVCPISMLSDALCVLGDLFIAGIFEIGKWEYRYVRS